ncbi:MAG: hypothetical protein V2B19_23590 [Pseudomonadota bacterium]
MVKKKFEIIVTPPVEREKTAFSKKVMSLPNISIVHVRAEAGPNILRLASAH